MFGAFGRLLERLVRLTALTIGVASYCWFTDYPQGSRLFVENFLHEGVETAAALGVTDSEVAAHLAIVASYQQRLERSRQVTSKKLQDLWEATIRYYDTLERLYDDGLPERWLSDTRGAFPQSFLTEVLFATRRDRGINLQQVHELKLCLKEAQDRLEQVLSSLRAKGTATLGPFSSVEEGFVVLDEADKWTERRIAENHRDLQTVADAMTSSPGEARLRVTMRDALMLRDRPFEGQRPNNMQIPWEPADKAWVARCTSRMSASEALPFTPYQQCVINLVSSSPLLLLSWSSSAIEDPVYLDMRRDFIAKKYPLFDQGFWREHFREDVPKQARLIMGEDRCDPSFAENLALVTTSVGNFVRALPEPAPR